MIYERICNVFQILNLNRDITMTISLSHLRWITMETRCCTDSDFHMWRRENLSFETANAIWFLLHFCGN